jgi:hypothetical protein
MVLNLTQKNRFHNSVITLKREISCSAGNRTPIPHSLHQSVLTDQSRTIETYRTCNHDYLSSWMRLFKIFPSLQANERYRHLQATSSLTVIPFKLPHRLLIISRRNFRNSHRLLKEENILYLVNLRLSLLIRLQGARPLWGHQNHWWIFLVLTAPPL